MARRSKEAEREQRIRMDIIADASGPEEQVASWYTYLAETLGFPFTAHLHGTASHFTPGARR